MNRENSRHFLPWLSWAAIALSALALATGILTGCGGTPRGDTPENRGSISPAPRPQTAEPTPSPTKSLPSLPPVREGYQPEPEEYAVMGDPSAPITIVEYSDYQ